MRLFPSLPNQPQKFPFIQGLDSQPLCLFQLGAGVGPRNDEIGVPAYAGDDPPSQCLYALLCLASRHVFQSASQDEISSAELSFSLWLLLQTDSRLEELFYALAVVLLMFLMQFSSFRPILTIVAQLGPLHRVHVLFWPSILRQAQPRHNQSLGIWNSSP